MGQTRNRWRGLPILEMKLPKHMRNPNLEGEEEGLPLSPSNGKRELNGDLENGGFPQKWRQ